MLRLKNCLKNKNFVNKFSLSSFKFKFSISNHKNFSTNYLSEYNHDIPKRRMNTTSDSSDLSDLEDRSDIRDLREEINKSTSNIIIDDEVELETENEVQLRTKSIYETETEGHSHFLMDRNFKCKLEHILILFLFY